MVSADGRIDLGAVPKASAALEPSDNISMANLLYAIMQYQVK